MIIEKEYEVKLSEIGKQNKITTKALLSYFEDIGGVHSNIAGYGIFDIPKTKLTWLLLEWKVIIKRRPKYTEKIRIKTWSKGSKRCYCYRDFEVFDEKGELIIIATSKWVLINTEKRKIVKVEDEVLNKYETEIEKSVINIDNLEKINEPENYNSSIQYIVKRTDIDINKHMHNLNYLDLAYEALPEDIFENVELNDIRINYKKEIKLGEKVNCKYSFENNKHIVAIKSEDDKILHAIIELK